MELLLCLQLQLVICMISNADADLPRMAKSTKTPALALPAARVVIVFDTPTILLFRQQAVAVAVFSARCSLMLHRCGQAPVLRTHFPLPSYSPFTSDNHSFLTCGMLGPLPALWAGGCPREQQQTVVPAFVES